MSLGRSSEDRRYMPMSMDRMSFDFASVVYHSVSRPMLPKHQVAPMDLREPLINRNSLSAFGQERIGNIPGVGLEPVNVVHRRIGGSPPIIVGLFPPGADPVGWITHENSYPSPDANPFRVHEPLPDMRLNVGVWRSNEGGTVGLGYNGAEMREAPMVDGLQLAQRENATAHATKDAREVVAPFVCPILGCGSTFTRHFNLRGASRLAFCCSEQRS
jgi:hypothetical protein